jgi:tonB-linked outer membrane protein, susC/ragA family
MEKLNLHSLHSRSLLTLRALLFLLMIGYGLSVRASDSKVSVNANGIALENVLKSIERQTKYRFIYSKETINVSVPVTLNVKDEALTTVLDQLLTKHDIVYTFDKKQIVLNKKSASQSHPSKLQVSKGKTIRIVGTVTDTQGEPLIGASVTIEGAHIGVTTDIDGNYEIDVPEGGRLMFSYIGFTPEKKKIDKAGRLDIVMSEDSQLLNEVVVIGYGTMDKKELTSAISHVSEKDFLTVSATDPTMLIQGKVPGVSITNTAAGDPNNTASVQIRGVSSRSAGLGPLIVIDGIPGGSLTNVNPNDIASFDILKDGAASAIYGTRGSNGVILVTTKKGAKDGTYKVTYAASVAWDKIIDELDFMDADDYRNIRLGWGDNGTDLGGDYDWFKGVGRTGFTQKHTLSISGGTERANFRVSADYRKSNGVDLRSGREEYGARASMDLKSKGDLINFNINVAPRIIYQDFANWSVFTNAKQANPTTPLMDPENPQLYYNFQGQVCPWNPVELQELEKNKGESKLLDMDATAKINLLPLLWNAERDCPFTLNSQVTFADHQYDYNNSWFLPSTSTIAINNGREGEASREYYKNRQYILEWLLNFGVKFGKNNAKVMMGYSYQYSQYSRLYAENKDFPNDGLGSDNLGAGSFAKDEGEVGMASYKSDNKLISFFGRVSYDYDGKYLMTASIRHEGSSKFGPNNKWGNFPAASIGWRISQESFMEDTQSWLNDLKIRADYGVTGNQDFDDYLSVAAMKGFGYYSFGGKYFQVWGPANNVNRNLKWEKAKNWNVGIDFSMFNSRFYGSLNYFNRRTEDLLGYYKVSIPPYLFDETFVNVGTMKNYGFEFDLNLNVVNSRDFDYSFSMIGSTMSNKFVDFSNSEYVGKDYYAICSTEAPYPNYNLQRIEKGESIGNFYMWKYVGISSEGEWLIEDKNGNVIKAAQGSEDDRRKVGNGLPKFTMSTTHSFRYKNFDLSLFFRGAFGFDIFNVHDFYYGTRKFNGNVLKKAYSKNFAISPTAGHAVTDYFLERGDYFKLDMLSVGYTLNLQKARFINKIRLYGTVHNVFTLTKFSGVDPSTYQVNGLTPGATGSRTYFPSTRQFMFGVQVDF